MDCKYCGGHNTADARVCVHCGQPLTRRATREQRQPSRSARLPWLIGAALLVVVGLSGWLLWQVQQVRQTDPVTASRTQQSKRHSVAAPFPTTSVKQIVADAVTKSGSTTAVAVAPVTGTQLVSQNNQPQRAAGLVGLFILVTVYQQADRGQLDLNGHYTLQAADKIGGTGTVQQLPIGTELTYAQLAQKMVTDSDNSAANILIKRVGGLAAINAEIKRLNLKDSRLERRLMDVNALKMGRDNYTSVNDLVSVFRRLYRHKLVSVRADTAMLTLLADSRDRTKLPSELPAEATVYNQTGAYLAYGVQNDVAIIKNTHGAFVVAAMAENGQAQTQIAAMGTLGTDLYQKILRAA